MKHIVCFSGGHSSGLVAIEVVRKYGKENVILLNHDINPRYEDEDIKRFKNEVADYLELPITYANHLNISNSKSIPSQFQVCIDAGTMTNPATKQAICTNRLKTKPFMDWLTKNFPVTPSLFEEKKECILYYGFDIQEKSRMIRRSSVMGAEGYRCDYPKIWKERTILDISDIGITKPNVYNVFIHANCTGCLKGGILHWYVVYVHRPDIYEEGIELENEVGFTINRVQRNGIKMRMSLEELAPIYEKMKNDGIEATEHQSANKFGRMLRGYEIEDDNGGKPCECII